MQNTAPTSYLLTRRDAAAYLAVSQRKLDGLVAASDIPVVRIGSCVRFEQADLDAYIVAQKSA